MKRFFEDFSNADDVFNSFDVSEKDREGVEILFAWYGSSGYEGSAVVLFRRNGKLYEANGSHCSCYGLEGCWGEEETTPDAIRKRDYYSMSDETKFALGAILKDLDGE